MTFLCLAQPWSWPKLVSLGGTPAGSATWEADRR